MGVVGSVDVDDGRMESGMEIGTWSVEVVVAVDSHGSELNTASLTIFWTVLSAFCVSSPPCLTKLVVNTSSSSEPSSHPCEMGAPGSSLLVLSTVRDSRTTRD